MAKRKEETTRTGWCPLFGIVPFSPPYPPSKPTSRCIQLIQDARGLLTVPCLNGIADNTISSYPTLEEISDWLSSFTPKLEYPRENIITARIISESSIHVWQYSIIHDARKDWYEKDNGEFEPVNTMALPCGDMRQGFLLTLIKYGLKIPT